MYDNNFNRRNGLSLALLLPCGIGMIRKKALGLLLVRCFFFQAEDGIRDIGVTGVQTCALPISRERDCTYVIGFMNGIVTSTASATKFSISRSMGRLYLDLTYSGSAVYRQATSPPRDVIPTRSPIPSTATKWSQNLGSMDVSLCTYKYRCEWHQPQEQCRRWQ